MAINSVGTLSSPGVGSNLDVAGIVNKLVAIDQAPIDTLDKKTASYQAKISGFGTLQGALAKFQTSVAALTSPTALVKTTGTVADTAVASVSADATASAGSYALEVKQLAQSQALHTAGQLSQTAAIGAGGTTTINFDFGTIAGGTFNTTTGQYTGASFTGNGAAGKSITIDASNNSLQGIRDAINQAGMGLTATIINDGNSQPYRLALKSTATGEAQSVRIGVSGDAALSSLLAQDPAGAQSLSQTQTAQNALLNIDGVAVSKPLNTISDAISGVTLNVAKTNVGTPTSVTVANDKTSLSTAVQNFVTAFNTINSTLNAATAYDAKTGTAAILNGENSVTSIQTQLRGILSTPVAGGSSPLKTLSQIGVSFQKDGSLAVNGPKLQAAAAANFKDIASLFGVVGAASDALVSVNASSAKTQPGSYAVNVTQIASQGTTTAYGAAGLTITAGSNDALNVSLDGVSAAVTLKPGTYTADALAAEVQSEINGAKVFSDAQRTVAVTQKAGVLSLTSNSYGSASQVNVTGGNGQANLKLDVGVTVLSGQDVAGTINGKTAQGNGQTLTAASGGSEEGLILTVAGGSLGSRGTVNFSKGYASKLNDAVTKVLEPKSSIGAVTDGYNKSIKDNAATRVRLAAKQEADKARYTKQFSALDTLISKMNTTSSFLTQQLANLPRIA